MLNFVCLCLWGQQSKEYNVKNYSITSMYIPQPIQKVGPKGPKGARGEPGESDEPSEAKVKSSPNIYIGYRGEKGYKGERGYQGMFFFSQNNNNMRNW